MSALPSVFFTRCRRLHTQSWLWRCRSPQSSGSRRCTGSCRQAYSPDHGRSSCHYGHSSTSSYRQLSLSCRRATSTTSQTAAGLRSVAVAAHPRLAGKVAGVGVIIVALGGVIGTSHCHVQSVCAGNAVQIVVIKNLVLRRAALVVIDARQVAHGVFEGCIARSAVIAQPRLTKPTAAGIIASNRIPPPGGVGQQTPPETGGQRLKAPTAHCLRTSPGITAEETCPGRV